MSAALAYAVPSAEPKAAASPFPRVLFTTDFSETSLNALPLAAAVARTFASELKLVHVFVGEQALIVPEYAPNLSGLLEREAEERLCALRDSDELRGLKTVSTEVFRKGLDGFTWKLANTDECDLVVMATHGSKGLHHLLLGSVAEQIIHTASCPVLTIGPHMRLGYGPEFHPRHILFATDGSPDSFRALPYAVQFARAQSTDLTLVHVLPNGREGIPEAEAFSALLCEGLHRCLPITAIKHCSPEVKVAFGDPSDQILRLARERGTELIVMGARSNTQRGKFSRSVSYRVLAHAACPVLTVRGHKF